MKILIIGQNPSTRTFRKRDGVPNNGSSIGRLYEWMNYMNINFYSFHNVCTHTGNVSKKDIDYDLLKSVTEGYDKIVALGEFASNALSNIERGHFKLPHPSGLNRKLNDQSFVKKVLYDCKKYIYFF